MTSLESLVTDLATSQLLKAAGFQQDTALVWMTVEIGKHNPMPPVVTQNPHMESMYPIVAAPTAEEILKELPETIDKMTLDVFGNADTWMVGWYEYQHLRGKLRDWMREKHGEQPGIVMQPLAIVAALAYLWWKEQA
jgi:hypothetical protein